MLTYKLIMKLSAFAVAAFTSCAALAAMADETSSSQVAQFTQSQSSEYRAPVIRRPNAIPKRDDEKTDYMYVSMKRTVSHCFLIPGTRELPLLFPDLCVPYKVPYQLLCAAA